MSSKKNLNNNSKKKQTKNNKKMILNEKIKTCLVILGIIIIILFTIVVILKIKLSKIQSKLTECENREVTLQEISPHYIFLGDSITAEYDLKKYYDGYSVVNSGIGRNTTDHILENMYERVYRYNPSTVFLMIGTNDVTYNKSAQYIFNNIKKIVELIQKNLPNTKIVVESITPSREEWGETDSNKKRQEVNNLLEKEYKNSSVEYIDLYSVLKEENSDKIKEEYTKDGLHLNDEGYKLITSKLKKYID